jgi:hypothetical protein
VKWQIIQFYMDQYCERYGTAHLENIVLMDEMQNGGTATKAAYLLDCYLEKVRRSNPGIALHLIAIQDERVIRHTHHARSRIYQQLVNKENPAAQRIQFHEFITPLFTVDASPVLPMIVTLYEQPPANRFHVVHNDLMRLYLQQRIQRK